MTEKKEPSMAPGQELTLHPGDPVRGADLLEENLREQEQESRQRAAEGQRPRERGENSGIPGPQQRIL